MARPKKTTEQYLKEYWKVIDAIKSEVPYRSISKHFGIGLSTVQRLHNRFFLKKF